MSDPVLVDRDFNDEMNVLILEALTRVGEADFIPSLVARELVTKLQDTDEELLSGWLSLHAKSFLSQLLTSHLRSFRAKARAGARASAFGADARRFAETGEIAVLSGWFNVRFVVDDQSTQRRLGDMTREDLLFVASRYGRTARTLLLEEAFHRALAARVGSRMVREVFTEEQIADMYRGLNGGTSVAAS